MATGPVVHWFALPAIAVVLAVFAYIMVVAGRRHVSVELTETVLRQGTEELPVKALPGLAQAFFDGILDGLAKRGIGFDRDGAKPLYTPRRDLVNTSQYLERRDSGLDWREFDMQDIPLRRRLITPHFVRYFWDRLFPLEDTEPVKYRYPRWAGLYQEGNQYLYVNRGFGFLGFPGRVGIWPEVTVITLRKGLPPVAVA